MFKGSIFLYKWVKTYLIQMAVLAIVSAVILFFGKEICLLIQPVWQPSFVYRVLKWIDYNSLTFYFGFIALCSVFLAIYNLTKFGKAIDQIMRGISGIYEMPDKKIILPQSFHEMELNLNEIRIKVHEDQQTAKEAIQRKNDLIMYMAHDLKTPLTSVIGYLSLVCSEGELPIELKEKYMNIALKKAYRLEDLINEFFDITRFNFTQMVLEKKSVNLTMMLKQMISEFTTEFEKKSLKVKYNIENDVMCVCDVGKMERVFDNLFKNIVNYSYENTDIAINLRRLEDDTVEIVTENRGKTIAPEMLEHIFEQFFRGDSARSTRTGGSGLGLAAAKEIIERHDGHIVCESADEMIRFRIILPVVRKS